MHITEILVHRLVGGTVDGGWPQGHEPQEDLHALVEVRSDEGLSGVGSVFTGYRLVEAGVEFLKPLWLRESCVEPQRVSEKLRQSSFWQGRGGTVEHVISGIDIALWDLMGKICQQPVSRLLGGNYRTRIKPYGSILFDEPDRLRDTLQATVARGFRAIKLGWRPFGRRSHHQGRGGRGCGASNRNCRGARGESLAARRRSSRDRCMLASLPGCV